MSKDDIDVYQPSGYALSSWNYGSFHHCNPHYLKQEFLKRRDNQNNEANNEHIRSQSANINKYGKRILSEDERIVSDEYLKMMRDFKVIKNNVNQNTLKRNKSTNAFRSNQSIRNNNNTNDNIQNISNSINNMNNTSNMYSNIPTKNMKYQLSYEEWAALKDKQKEIYNKVKSIKDSEDQKFDFFNKKINDNYQLIK